LTAVCLPQAKACGYRAWWLSVVLLSTLVTATAADSLAQRVWNRYANARSLQLRAVARFEDLSLEAKPSVYENTDPARWKRMEQEVKRLAGQEIRTEIIVERPNRMYLEEKSAFGWFQSVSDGKVWQVKRQDGSQAKTAAPPALHQMAQQRYWMYLGLDGENDIDVLRLLAIGSPRLRNKLLHTTVQSSDKPNIKLLRWSEPIIYQGLKGQGTITCFVDTRTALIRRVEYRFHVGVGAEAWLHMVIGQQWDNSRLSQPPAASRFHIDQKGEVPRR
jgi:hypothetical protein